MRVLTTDKTFAVLAYLIQSKALQLDQAARAIEVISRAPQDQYECGDRALADLLRAWRELRAASDRVSRAVVVVAPRGLPADEVATVPTSTVRLDGDA